jgi:hypothetical protein
MTLVEEIVAQDPVLAEKLRLAPTNRLLGRGQSGSVYLAGMHAVKITTCRYEALRAKQLIGRRLKHFVRIVSVHKIRTGTYFLIRMERLEKVRVDYPQMCGIFIKVNRSLGRINLAFTDKHQGNICRCPRTGVLKVVDPGGLRDCET